MSNSIQLSPVEYLRRYQESFRPRLAFKSRDIEQFKKWKIAVRNKLHHLLGIGRMANWQCDLVPLEDPMEVRDSYTQQRVTIQTAPGFRIPLIVLRPKKGTQFKPVLALHGHGYGKSDVCGTEEDVDKRTFRDRVQYRYAIEAVKRGYIVFAPDKRAFGELMEDRDRIPEKPHDEYRSCEWHTMAAILLGMTQIGLHVWDNKRVLDYIETRTDSRDGGVAAFGVSGGGQATLWLSALDDRVEVAVVSGHLGSYRSSILMTDGCPCNTVPHLLLWVEKSDIAGLIAPRPLLVESGSQDNWYSRSSQLECYAEIQKIYRVAQASDRLDIDLFDGPHRWSGRKAWAWIDQWYS